MNYGMIVVEELLRQIKTVKREAETKDVKEYNKAMTPYVIMLTLIRKNGLPDKFMYSYRDISKIVNLTIGTVNAIIRKNNIKRKVVKINESRES